MWSVPVPVYGARARQVPSLLRRGPGEGYTPRSACSLVPRSHACMSINAIIIKLINVVYTVWKRSLNKNRTFLELLVLVVKKGRDCERSRAGRHGPSSRHKYTLASLASSPGREGHGDEAR